MTAASSPLLSPDDLFTHLRSSLGLSLTSVEEILKPKAENMRQVYAELLGICYGRRQTLLLGHGSLRALENVSYPELVEGQIPIPVLFHKLRDLLHHLTNFDLQLRDLLSPDPRRNRIILSEVVNFLKFRTDEEIILDEEGREVSATAFTEEHQRVQEELDRTQLDVQTLRQKLHDLEGIVVPKQLKIQLLTDEKTKMEETRRELETDIKRLEGELSQAEELTRKMNSQSQILEEKLVTLEGQVTNSPERIANSLQEAQEMYEKEETQTVQLQEKVLQLSSKIQNLQKTQNRLREALLILEPYQMTIGENQRLKRVISEKHSEKLALDNEIKRLELSVNSYTRETRKYEEQKSRTLASNEAKLILLDKQREERVQEKGKEQRSVSELQEKIGEVVKEIQGMEEGIGQLEGVQAGELVELMQLQGRVMMAVERVVMETGKIMDKGIRGFEVSRGQ